MRSLDILQFNESIFLHPVTQTLSVEFKSYRIVTIEVEFGVEGKIALFFNKTTTTEKLIMKVDVKMFNGLVALVHLFVGLAAL